MDVGIRCIISLWKVASFRNREVIRYLFQRNGGCVKTKAHPLLFLI